MEIVLGPQAAHACPIKVRNAYTPGLEIPAPGPSPALAAADVERMLIMDAFAAAHPLAIDLRSMHDAPRLEREQASVEAMRGGADVIMDAMLPSDPDAHRSGTVDILVRGRPSSTGLPGYRPIQVHRRRVLEARPREEVLLSTFERPRLNQGRLSPDIAVRRSRLGDRIQLAHLWHLLSSTDHASLGMRFGGLIGSDTVRTVAWIPLDEPSMPPSPWIATMSSATQVSAMERYEQEFSLRVRVAENALAGAPRQLVPIRTHECVPCPWWSVCEPLFDPDDISLRINKWPLDAHEISALRSLGVWTIHDLAAADMDELLPRYEDLVSHRPEVPARLQAAARRARLLIAGDELERTTKGPIHLPTSALEVDLDIEASADNRVYLWGFLVHDVSGGAEPYYKAFAEFGELNDQAEAELALRAMTWLRDLIAGSDAPVYHYSDYELVRLAHIAAQAPDLEWAPGFAEDHFVDLFAVMRAHYFAVHGLGLKNVAAHGAGFSWRDPEAGGLNSQGWFNDAVRGPVAEREAARQRVLAYNEDDVRATWHLRRWLRTAT